jgi:hypothetical protein
MTIKHLTLACALTSSLAACGGGGGGADAAKNTNNPTTQSAPVRTVGGVASKGTIKNGIVNVYAYDAAGKRGATPVATGRTSNSDGSYSIDLGNRNGWFLIEVGADAATTMEDEYDGRIAMPATMTLRTLVQVDNASNQVIAGHVTPFTDMLVTAALSADPSGNLMPDNVAAAQSDIVEMLGFDPLSTKPLNAASDAAATGDAAEKMQAVALAAISQIAHDNAMGCTGNPGEKVRCAVKATTGSAVMKNGMVSISAEAKQNLLATLDSTAQNTSVNKTSLTSLAGQKLFADAATPASAAHAPARAPQPAVESTKATFASLRTNLQAWSDETKDGSGLRTSLDTMQTEFETAVAPLDQSLADWVVLSGQGIKLFNNFVQKKSSLFKLVEGPDDEAPGICTLYKDNNATVAMTAADVGRVTPQSVSCALTGMTLAASEKPAAQANLFVRDQIVKSIVLTPGGTGNFSYRALTQRVNQQYRKTAQGEAYAVQALAPAATIGLAASGNLSYTMQGDDIHTASISGYMPARTDDKGVAITDREAWRLAFTTTRESALVTKYAFNGHIDALRGGASLGAVDLGNESFVRVSTAGGKEQVIEGKLALGATAGRTTVNGTLALSKFSTDKKNARYVPTLAQFTGGFTSTRGESFTGTVTLNLLNYKAYDNALPLSATNFPTSSAAFSGSLKIISRPTLAVTFAARAVGYQRTEFNATYNDGKNFIIFTGDNSLPRAINITSASGVRVKLVDNVKTVDVFKNNNKVAQMNLNNMLITYIDGSFETLK